MTIYRHTATGPGPAGDVWNVTLHSSTAGTLANAHAAFSTFVSTFVTGVIGPLWSTETQVTGLQTSQLDPATGKNVAQVQSVVTLKGTGSGAALPQRVSLVAGLRTALPTRAGRGRMYWPAPESSQLTTTGQLLSATAASISAGMASRLATMGLTAAPIIYHRALKFGTPITSVTVSTTLGTQRRRTNKVPPAYSESSL